MNLFEMMNLLIGFQSDAAAATEVQSVWDFVRKGGPMMIPIILCSLVALAVLAERLIVLRRRRVIPPDFLDGLTRVLRDPARDRGRALAYCRQNSSPLARVFAAGIRKLGSSEELIEKHIVEAGQREVIKLRKHLRVLSVIAAVSPLLGLLGTIFGMILAFQTVAGAPEALGRTEMLAEGIYQAMITTAAGLIVAIPTLIFYHWLSARIERLVMEIDQMSVEFVEEYVATGRNSTELDEVKRAEPIADTTSTDASAPGEPSVSVTS